MSDPSYEQLRDAAVLYQAEWDIERERAEAAEQVLRTALPSLGANQRSYAQAALEEACALLNEDPDAWRGPGELALEREWREKVAQAEQERDEAMKGLWDAYVATGADTDGDEKWHASPADAARYTVLAVEELRRDYEASGD